MILVVLISALYMDDSFCIAEDVQSVGHEPCLFIDWATCLKTLRSPGIVPQDPRGPPANCGTHRVNWRYMISSRNIRQQFMS